MQFILLRLNIENVNEKLKLIKKNCNRSKKKMTIEMKVWTLWSIEVNNHSIYI